MTAWKKDMGLAGSDLIEFVADTDADLTVALGLVLTGDGKPCVLAGIVRRAFRAPRDRALTRGSAERLVVALSSAGTVHGRGRTMPSVSTRSGASDRQCTW
jgi:hypothetical protein